MAPAAGRRTIHDADPLRPRLMTLTGTVGALATLGILVFPSARFAYHSPGFHVGLEVAAGLIAGLAAFLFFGRLKHNRLQANWALVYALLLSSAVNILLSAVPAMVDSESAGTFAVWAAVGGRLVAAASFVFAAYAPAEWVTKGEHIGYTVVAGVVVTIGVLGLVTIQAMPGVPAIDVVLDTTRPFISVHPSLLLVQLISMLLFTAAAFGFIRRSERTGDQLMRWLAAGALLAAFSRLHYVLFPSLYADWVYTGDILRLAFYVLLLLGAVGEIRRYWTGLADAATTDERRRIARDLHDGLAQELAYIAVQSRWLSNHGDDSGTTLRSITAAADRALDESRRAIAALTSTDDEPLDLALAQAAEEVADRVGTQVRLDLARVRPLQADAQEGLIRIAREAIANAGRHSGADEVLVRLSQNGSVRLEVTDEGRGFDPGEAPPDRYGLISMRERAEAMNAEFFVISSPGRGTTVEVALQ